MKDPYFMILESCQALARAAHFRLNSTALAFSSWTQSPVYDQMSGSGRRTWVACHFVARVEHPLCSVVRSWRMII